MDDNQFIELEYKSKGLEKELRKKKNGKYIVFRHGHIAITDVGKKDLYEFKKLLSVWDKVNFKYRPVGYYYVAGMRELRISRGFNRELLKEWFPNYQFIVDNDPIPCDTIDIELTTPPRDDYQKTGLTFMASKGKYKDNAKYTQQLIDGNTGSGKAMPDNSLIPTPKGMVKLKDLQVGDYVFNRYGKPTKILDIFPQREQDTVITVKFEDGRSVECNLEHLWAVSINQEPEVLVTTWDIQRLLARKNNVTVYGPVKYSYDNNKLTIHSMGSIKIVSIEWGDIAHQRCILVDDPEHLFLTEQFIPTHNTYLGAATTAYLKRRCIIIVPFAKLINQWKDTFLNFTTLTEDDIVVVQGSKMCEKVIKGKYQDAKVFIVMANTLNSFHKTAGDIGLYDFFYATQAGIKIIDEVHRDMTMIQKIEALSNFRWNYYMSATPGRSDRKENWIYKMSYFNVPKFGSEFMTDDEKHLQIMIKKYLFLPNQKQINRIVNKRVGMNTKSYETELRTSSEEQRQGFDNALRVVLEWVKNNLQKDYKLMILAYTIDFLSYLKEIAEEVFPGEVSIYYGGMKKDDKEKALKTRIIVATSSSLGTGADIKGLQFVINTTTYSNWIEAKQISGRLREIKGVPQVYIELVNFGWYKTVRQFEKRKKYLVDISKTKKLIVVN